MVKVSFKKGLLANLPVALSEGTFYVATDEPALYLDVDGSTRIRISDFQEYATLADLEANANPSATALYYVAELNVLAKWNGTKYVLINLDTGATSAKKTGEGNALSGVSYNPDTRELTFTTIALPTAADVDAKIAAKVGEVAEGKTVVQMIDEAKAAATYDDTALKGRISTLEGSDAGKSARTIAAEETAKIVAGADTAYDTLKEISDWISSHKTDAGAMNSAILALEAIVDGIGGEGEKATVVAYVTDAIAALKIGDYAKAADLTALASRVTTLEGKVHEHENKALLDTYTQTEANLADAVNKKHAHANAAELDKIAAGDKAKWDAAEQNAKDYADGLAGNYDAKGDAAKALSDAKSYTNTVLAWGSF